LESIADRSCAQSLLNQDDNIYYNIVINNPTNKSINADYSEQKVKPIIENPEQYYLSVIRFSLAGQDLPIFFFKDNTYFITLSYAGNDYAFPVVYQALNNVVGEKQTVYAYQHMINMINTTFSNCFVALQTDHPGVPVTEAPYMTYDASTNLFSLWCQQAYEGAVEIWFNNILYYFFDNFLTFYAGEDNANRKDFRFEIQDLRNNIPDQPPGYYYFTQEYNSLFNWADLKTISFKTATIPVRYEYTPNASTSNTGEINFNPVMIDFELNPETNSLYREFLSYNPTGQYRLIDLTGREPLSNINISISWKDQNQNEYPFRIPPRRSVSMKLLFVKKSLYKDTKDF